jgi:hypothetical protein
MRLYNKSTTANCSCTLETVGKHKSYNVNLTSNGNSTAVLTVFILLSFPLAIPNSWQSIMTKYSGYTLISSCRVVIVRPLQQSQS